VAPRGRQAAIYSFEMPPFSLICQVSRQISGRACLIYRSVTVNLE
jgi:hypothetical protein